MTSAHSETRFEIEVTQHKKINADYIIIIVLANFLFQLRFLFVDTSFSCNTSSC